MPDVCPLLKKRRGGFQRYPHAPGQRYADERSENRGFPVQAAFADAERAGRRASRAFGASRPKLRDFVFVPRMTADLL